MNLISEIAIPVFAILVPSGIAIWLARAERNAARAERQVQALERADERAERGVEAALDAMSDLVDSGYNVNVREAAALRIRAARSMGRAATYLSGAHDEVLDWLILELGVVAGGLEDRDDMFLPRDLEKIGWRSGTFTDTLLDWRTGEKTSEWFKDAGHPDLSDSRMPGGQATAN